MHEGTEKSMIAAPFSHPWGWAAAAPIACAIHCAAMPVIALFAPSMVAGAGSGIEWGLFVVTLLFSGVALTFGIRTHGSLRPIAPIALGVAIWTASLLFSPQLPGVEVTTMASSILVASGLLWSSRMCCVPEDSCCPACHDAPAHSEVDEFGGTAESSI